MCVCMMLWDACCPHGRVRAYMGLRHYGSMFLPQVPTLFALATTPLDVSSSSVNENMTFKTLAGAFRSC